MSEHGRQRLSSWKEIATYLRREVRTVIRWEKERGLPVHRVPGGQGRSVFAYTDELDRWAGSGSAVNGGLNGNGTKHRRRRAASVILAVTVAGLLAVTASTLLLARVWPHAELTEAIVANAAIEGRDASGRTRWSYALPGRTETFQRRAAQIVDLTGDGHQDAVVTAILSPAADGAPEAGLYALNEAGDLLWKRALDRRLSFRADEFDGPWMPDDVMAFRSGGEPLVAWAVHHLTWWPSLLAVYDARGGLRGTFVNAGWIRTSRASADGRHILTGGFSNSRNGAAFAVIDAGQPDGASPEDPGSPYECRSCPAGRPVRYFVVDWSDLATPLPPDEREATVVVHPASGAIELRAQQRRGVEVIVELSAAFEITRRAVSDGYWEWHRRLELSGGVTHSRDACPYRDGPVVREWAPASGWRVHGG